MIEKYCYSKLDELKQSNDTVNIWAIITFISLTGTEVKMMIVDESELQIFCVLNVERAQNFGCTPLSNSMVVRIHRCKVLRAINNQITIIGRINCAGLHVAAWCVDDLECTTRYRSSEGFTFDHRSDAQRLQELRTFWKRRVTDDGIARKLFFEMVNFRQSLLFARDKRNPAALVAVDHRCAPENANDISFDQFAQSAPRGETVADNGNRLAHHVAHPKNELLMPDEAFLAALMETIRHIAQESPHNSKCISFSKVMQKNLYFDIICQVVAVHVPFDGLESAYPTYLSVCDGTKANIDGTWYYVGGATHSVKSQLFTDEVFSTEFKNFIYVIGCWDDYSSKASKLEAGDFVRILNCKIAEDSNGFTRVSLHGHTANSAQRYKRDIECVRKRRLSVSASREGTETNGACPIWKRTLRRGDDGVHEVTE